jgi:hypothetical protein
MGVPTAIAQAVRAVFRGAQPIEGIPPDGEPGQWEHIFVIDLLDDTSGTQIYQLAAGVNVMPVVSKIAVTALTQTDYAAGTGAVNKRLTFRMPIP